MDRYEKGSAQRAQSLADFVQFQAETKTKLKQANHDLNTKQQKLSDTQTQLAASKVEYYQKRVARLETATKTAAQSLTAGLSASELKWLIVHACQMAGEMEEAEDGKTCVPLRLAALDSGIIWDGNEARSAVEADKVAVVADIFYRNSEENAESIIWKESELDSNAKKMKKKAHGRRLMRVVEAEDYDDNYDDYMYDEDYYGDEDGDDSELDQPVHGEDTIQTENTADEMPKDDEKTAAFLAELDKQPFMKMRASFSIKATELINAIDEALVMEEEEESEEKMVADEEAEDLTEIAPQFDPIAYKMVRNTLDKRKKSLERGIGYGLSARFFLESLEQKLDDADALVHRLSLLAVGTLSYGNISAPQYYETLASAVPELQNENDAQTCASPWSRICPPRALDRAGISIPAANILSAVKTFCATELTKDAVSDGSCAAASTEQSSSSDPIPSNVPDGYYGYYEVKGRVDETVLAELFIDVGVVAKGDELAIRLKLAELEEAEDRLENDVSSLQAKVRDLEDSIGGDDPDKFGPNGELHSLRDKCFEVEEGKYVYEVCLFGKATQKDKGSTGAGTNLGKWTRASTETVTDEKNREYPQRIWHWENGTKCWNGPQRSATAYVTCGAETKVLSADEPDTCRYVLDMESPIACDDEFRERNGL